MSHSATAGATNEPLSRAHHLLITLSVMLATFMQSLDTTIANVALPHMQGSMSASQDQIVWILTSYIVASAITTPLTGWLCDRFGQKQVFLMSVGGFTVASILCGLSGTLGEIVIARLLQGIFGAALVPLSQVVLLDINPLEKQGRAMAVWGMGVTAAPILGPVLGGWLTDRYDWRWVFFINVPLGVIAFYGIFRFMRHDVGPRRLRFDMFGFTALSLAVGALQLLLDRGEQNDWFASAESCCEAVVAGVAFTYFVVHTILTPAHKSFFNYHLLKDRSFATGLPFVLIISLVLFSTRALLPVMLQNLLQYPAMLSGFVTGPSGLGTVAAMLLAGRLMGFMDYRALMLIGLCVSAFSLWQMCGYSLRLTQANVIWTGVIQGLGLGMVFVPMSSMSFSTLPADLRAQGTAIVSLVRNIGSSVGISMTQTLLVRNTQIVHAALTEKVTTANPALNSPALSSFFQPGDAMSMSILNNEISRQATMIAYIDDFYLLLILTLLVTPLLLLLKAPSAGAEQPAHAAME